MKCVAKLPLSFLSSWNSNVYQNFNEIGPKSAKIYEVKLKMGFYGEFLAGVAVQCVLEFGLPSDSARVARPQPRPLPDWSETWPRPTHVLAAHPIQLMGSPQVDVSKCKRVSNPACHLCLLPTSISAERRIWIGAGR